MAEAAPVRLLFDRFEVIRELGQGAFGATYLCEDLALRRKVVLKVAREISKAAERIAAEAQVARLDHHPNIVRLFEARPEYLVFEYVEGAPLNDVISRGPLPIENALEVASAVGAALEHAHAQGIIHRDLKPANILIPKSGYRDAKLMDFGVLGELGESGSTRAGVVFGTPYSMAPEQVQGLANSAATDVYGLAAVLYRMIYGRWPFEGPDVATVLTTTVLAAVTFPGEPPVPDRIRELLRRALAKDPRERPGVGEFVSLDGRIESDAPADIAEAAAPAPAPRGAEITMAKAAPRRRIWIWIFAAVAGLLVLLAALTLWPAGGLPPTQTSPNMPGPPPTGAPVAGIGRGVLLALLYSGAGFAASWGLRRYIDSRKPEARAEAERVLLSAERHKSLTETLAIQVDELFTLCKQVDQRILWTTIAVMVDRYRSGNDAQDLMNATELLDKLMQRLTPWYVRYEKAIGAGAALVGIGTGLATLVQTVARR